MMPDFQIGQKLKHYACGKIVEAEIIEVSRMRQHIKTKHETINWHNQDFSETIIKYDERLRAMVPAIIE